MIDPPHSFGTYRCSSQLEAVDSCFKSSVRHHFGVVGPRQTSLSPASAVPLQPLRLEPIDPSLFTYAMTPRDWRSER